MDHQNPTRRNPAQKKNRARWSVDLLPVPESVGGLTVLGTINRNTLIDPLLTDGVSFFAQTPRGLEELRTDKVRATLSGHKKDPI